MSTDIIVKDGYMYGGWRQPVNTAASMRGSLHDDEAAQGLGWRGGAVAGIIHLNLFPPLLIEFFGRRWFDLGSISVFYTYAITDREEVRAVIKVPPKGVHDVQTEAWVETPDGNTVCKGTVSVGSPDELSYLKALGLENAPPNELRILAGLKTGDELTPRDEVVITQEEVNRALETITDPLDWYKGNSPWGGAILPLATMQSALNIGFIGGGEYEAAAFYGATELRNVDGPVKVGVRYRTTGQIACVGASPKTEYAWIDSCLEEKGTGRKVAEMRHMTRWLKASSQLYRAST